MNFEIARGIATWSLHAAGAVLDPMELPHLVTGHIRSRRFRLRVLKSSTTAHVKELIEDGLIPLWPGEWNIVVFPSCSVSAGAGAAIERLGMVAVDPYGLDDVLKLWDWTPGETPPPIPSPRARKK